MNDSLSYFEESKNDFMHMGDSPINETYAPSDARFEEERVVQSEQSCLAPTKDS